MEQKTFPAFGYYVIRNKVAAGEIISDDTYVNGLVNIVTPFNICWLYTKGLVHNVNVATGEVSVRPPGYCNTDPKETAGVWRADFLEDSVVFCVPAQQSHTAARPLIDLLTPFILPAGQSTTLPQGTKLSLCQGSLLIGDNTIPALRQVELKTGERTVTAIEECYGLIFP